MEYTVMKCLYYILCMVCMVLVGEWTYHWTVRDWKKFVLAGVIYAAGFVYCIVLGHNDTSLFLIIEMFVWALISEAKWSKKLIRVVIWPYVTGFVEAIISLLLNVVVGDTVAVEVIELVQIVLTIMVWTVIAKRKWYQKAIEYIESTSIIKKLLISSVIFFGVGVAAFGLELQILSEYSRAAGAFGALVMLELCLITAVVIWLVVEGQQKKYYAEQNHLKEEYIRVQQDYNQIIYMKDKELRSFRHDVANQIGLLQMLMKQGKIEEANAQLASISQAFQRATVQTVRTGNGMLDAILSMMNQKAVEKGITLEINGELQNESGHNIYALCSIFSNAVGNAIEACDKLGGEKTVQIKLVEHNRSLCCIFENPASAVMYQAVIEGKTTKEDAENHGHGVKNIRHAVERLGGEMEYRYEDGKIRLEIIL